jgi:tight adherence protein C
MAGGLWRDMMQYGILILFMISFGALLYTLMNRGAAAQQSVKERLTRIRTDHAAEADEVYSRSFSDRVLKPALDGIGRYLMRMAPAELVGNLEKKIIMAGRPYGLSARTWFGIQTVMTVVMPVGLLLLLLQAKADMARGFLLILAVAGIGLLLPNLILNGKIRERQKSILKTMPDVMDLLTVSVEAGLGFDAALSKVVEKMPGTLSEEFRVLLSEIKIGKSRKDAMYQMADRIGVQDFRSFISAVIQADQLGVSLGRVLRIQSEQIRLNRRQRIQEKAMKAPIKMLIPMVVFIFPAIFIILLGPTAINLIHMFATQ